MKPKKVPVSCPKCGHTQQEPAGAISTVCKKCYQHIRLDGAPPPAAFHKAKPQVVVGELRGVTCFNCSAALEVPVTAQSTMCKRCSSHLDLRDYSVNSAVSKNFKTRGRFTIEETGYLFNTDSYAGEAIIKGRLLGKITADTLEIHSTAQIKGGFQAGKLILPPGTKFRWDTLSLVNADIGGELVCNIFARQTVLLRSSSKFFGNIQAGALVVEEGAVIVGEIKINAPQPQPMVTAAAA